MFLSYRHRLHCVYLMVMFESFQNLNKYEAWFWYICVFFLIGTPINKRPVLGYRNLNLFKLFRLVHKLGGFDNVSITIRSETCSSYKNLRIKGRENGEYKLEIAS